MTLLQPSFRGRLRLFFVVIVLLPMIALAVVAFNLLGRLENGRLDAKLGEAQYTATKLYEQALDASAAAATAAGQQSSPLATALQAGDREEVGTQLELLTRRVKAQRIVLKVNSLGTFEAGSRDGIAPEQAPLSDANGQEIGRITVYARSASSYARELRGLLNAHARVDRGNTMLATTLAAAGNVRLSGEQGADVKIRGTDYRTTAFLARDADGQTTAVRLLQPVTDR